VAAAAAETARDEAPEVPLHAAAAYMSPPETIAGLVIAAPATSFPVTVDPVGIQTKVDPAVPLAVLETPAQHEVAVVHLVAPVVVQPGIKLATVDAF